MCINKMRRPVTRYFIEVRQGAMREVELKVLDKFVLILNV